MKIEIEKTVRLGAETHPALEHMRLLIHAWSGGESDLVHFYEPQSACFRRTRPPFAFWRIHAAAFEQFGPLPFTSGGKPVRWSWRYWLRGAPTITVAESDLHQ